MVKKFAALLLGLGFIILFLQETASLAVMLGVVVGLSVLAAVAKFFLYRQDLTSKLDLTMVALPTAWILGSAAVLFRIDYFSVRLALAIASAMVLVKLELTPLLRGSAFIENVSFLSAVGIFFGIWTINFYTVPPWWLVMVAVLAATFAMLWIELYNTPAPAHEKLLFSLFLAFASSEVAWGLLFWPIHYVSVTVVFSAMYYLGAQLCRFYLLGSLTRKKIIFHSVFVCLVGCAVLATALWLPHS